MTTPGWEGEGAPEAVRPNAMTDNHRKENHPSKPVLRARDPHKSYGTSCVTADGVALLARLSRVYRRWSTMAIVMSAAGTRVKP